MPRRGLNATGVGMLPWVIGILAIGVWFVLFGPALAQTELVRPHVPGYETPDWRAKIKEATAPNPVWDYVDVGFLVVAIGAASYLAIRARSRRGLVILAAISLFWLGFVRQGCICPIGAIQNVALTLADPSYSLPLTVAVLFVAPILLTLAFGRTFCGAVCPLGAVQELVAVLPMRIPRWVDEVLGLLPYGYLGLGILTAVCSGYFLICQYDPFVSFFRLGANFEVWLFSFAFLGLGIIVARPYCRFLCPLGAIFRIVAPLSRWHLKIHPSRCISCRLCEDVCPYNAIRRATGQTPEASEIPVKTSPLVVALLIGAIWTVGAVSGFLLGPVLARLDWRVQLAEQIWYEESGLAAETTDASDVFRKSGTPISELYQQAAAIENRYRFGAVLVGIWLAFVASTKLVQLQTPARRDEYEPERSKCYCCGRCFRFCPIELQRLGLLDEESLAVYVKSRGPG
ncbi:MAG: 4Fe-4S binding protein [Thermoguttaceae bacterium]|nr:4Fe-4S binding protein [Thermoguttaceae bacterium]MDW8078121.1 4Fe-4S binding protein [Thermoguttaceae bacterium]